MPTRFHEDTYGTLVGCLWDPERIPIDLLDILVDAYGIRMGSLCNAYAVPIGFLDDPYGIPIGIL